ncbi:DUF2207 domain-containing protein [Agromyces intestinalis]|uniref:DUF2207 domain-containing protein n=1 Tax=Agromyces intestinalis TaxID=2592652 RepID=A0A5C1YCC4_9MICO|nr:DUF2207 domain-containing protein [Agromyces intestinalis]QEO13230.1 DUF2207 domain-containing protein [Agromyces intestinalis]
MSPRHPNDEVPARIPSDEPDATDDDLPAPPDSIPDDRPRHTPLWALLSRWLLQLEAWLRSHGGIPLRRGIRVFWTLVAAAGVVLLVGPVINPPLTLEDITSSASTATEDWIAREFAADYDLTRDEAGGLRAAVEERITAHFPDDVDRTGIRRVLATQYQGHALEPERITATLDGEAIDVEQAAGATRLTLTLDAGERLDGDHEFVLRYELRDLAYEAVDEASGTQVDLLEWDVFGPSWPQAFSGLDVSVTLPEDVDDRLIRQPRGALAWTLIGGGEWLEPEDDSPAGTVTYRLTNDQNIPPHANAWFTMSFERRTFAMPGPSPLFLTQTFGPLLPLAFLTIVLLLALAARAVAWGDARGRPWIVARHDPPGVAPVAAAHVLGAPRAVALADALAAIPRRGPASAGDEQRLDAARAARRAGRLGDLPRALGRYWSRGARRAQIDQGWRRVPRGFVRDLFLAAPPALVLVQWGLVRQLSHQAKLAIVWWPAAFVIVSTVIAAVVVWIAWSTRPLTRRGALLKQHLRGIGVFAERTQLLDRGPSRDLALPYAVLVAPAREAGRRVAAMLDAELDGRARVHGWRTPTYLSWTRLLVIGASVLLVPAAIAMVATVPNPYERGLTYRAYEGDVPGSLWVEANSAELGAELARTADGRAEIRVIERMSVTFDDSSSRVPQLADQWRNVVDGQQLDVRVDSVRIDGEAVPFATEQDRDTLLMRTTMTDVLAGTFDTVIEYTIGSAAVATVDRDGDVVDRVRWVALLEGWDSAQLFPTWDHAIEPLHVEFRLSEELAGLATSAGWITRDTDTGEHPRDWAEAVVPFGSLADEADPDRYAGTAESTDASGGMRSYGLELHDSDYGYPFALTVDDLGVALDFPQGTFTGPDDVARGSAAARQAFPFATNLTLALLAITVAGAGILGRRQHWATRPGPGRDLVRWFAPLSALASTILFFWLCGDMVPDHPVLPALGFPTLAAVVLAVWALIATRRRPAG